MKASWHIIFRFPGNPDWEQLNDLISFETGSDVPFFETENDYNLSLLEGFITFDGKETTVWADGEYEE